MRNTLLLIWWLLTPLLLFLTLFGPRLFGEPGTGATGFVGPAIAIVTVVWIVFSAGLILTRNKSAGDNATPDKNQKSDSEPA